MIVQREKWKDSRFLISLAGATVLALLALIIGGVVISTLPLRHPTMVFGPGFYPLLMSLLMLISCLGVIFNLLYGETEKEVAKAGFAPAVIKKPFMLALLIVVFFAAMPLLGFVVAMFLFSYLELTYLETDKEPFIRRVIYSAAISGGVYGMFRSLTIYLPTPFWW